MPAGNGPYRPGVPIAAEIASGAVVLRGELVLLIHHREEDRWCLPKGHVDPGESLEDTARREVREETGLADVRLEQEVGEVTYRFFSGSRRCNVHKTTVYFLGRSGSGEVGLEEGFDRSAWVTYPEAARLVRYDSDRTVLERARELSRGPP